METLRYAVVNPDGTYAGVPCITFEEALQMAAQREGRRIFALEEVAVCEESEAVCKEPEVVLVQLIQNIPAGSLIRTINPSTDRPFQHGIVYRVVGYDRSAKAYKAVMVEDSCRAIYLKKNRKAIVVHDV